MQKKGSLCCLTNCKRKKTDVSEGRENDPPGSIYGQMTYMTSHSVYQLKDTLKELKNNSLRIQFLTKPTQDRD
jgi:hypothetical protein